MFKLEAFKRKFCDGKTDVVTFRFPDKLKNKLQEYAEKNGRTTTDIVVTALDQFVQEIEVQERMSKRGTK